MTRRKTDAPRGVLRSSPSPEAAFLHERLHPPDNLADWVEHFWYVVWDLRGKPPYPVSTLPHPSVHLVFETGLGGVMGPSRERFTRNLSGKGRVFAVKFRPGGFRPFVQAPVSRFTDRTVPFSDVFGAPGRELEQAVLGTDCLNEQIAMVDCFLGSFAVSPDDQASQAADLCAQIAQTPGMVSVRQLSESCGLGIRKLQRLFANYVGIGPKWVIQRYRLHEAAARLESGSIDQVELALELGYSDQAHFIRDFKALVGKTPVAYAQAQS